MPEQEKLTVWPNNIMEIHMTWDSSHMERGGAGLSDQRNKGVNVWHWFNLVSFWVNWGTKLESDAAERAAGFLLHYLHRLQT